MRIMPINWWTLIAAILSNFIVGGLWYSPILFIKPWLAMSGVSKTVFDAGLSRALIGDLFSSVVLALSINQIVRMADASSLGQSLAITTWLWLGFVVAVLIGSVTYEHRPLEYLAINSGYRLLTMTIMGAILTLWR